MAENFNHNKMSELLNKMLKRGSQYTKRAKVELQSMTLLSKKENAFKELGRYIYQQIKKNNDNFINELTFKSILSEIYKIEDEEKKIKKDLE